MKRTGRIIKLPTGREKFPHVPDNQHEKIHFFPFIAANGISDRASALRANAKKINAVINGKAPVMLKWFEAQQSVSWAKEESEAVTHDTKFKRNFRIGRFFTGVTLSNEYSHQFYEKNTGFKSVQGDNLNYVESTDERTITIATDTDFFTNRATTIKSDVAEGLGRLFFVCPELAPEDVLYISGMRTIPDPSQNIRHFEITFSSITDKLEKVGASLRQYIQFAGPGQGYPYPFVEADQKDNKTMFYDDKKEPLPFTKRVYLDKDRIEDKGVTNFSVEFNGAALVSSIELMGKPVIPATEEERAKGYFKLDRIRPLMVTEFFGENKGARDFYASNEITDFQLLHGVVSMESWFNEWRDEFALYFDPRKARESQLSLQCWYNNDDTVFRGAELAPKRTITSSEAKIFGRWANSWNKYSKYNLDPRYDTNQTRTFVSSKDYNTGIKTISDLLNTNFMYQNGVSYLESLGIKTINRKGSQQAIVKNIISVAGSIVGGGIGLAAKKNKAIGVGVGTHIGGQVTGVVDLVYSWLPDRWFTDQNIYRPTVMTTFLAPKKLLDDFAHKIGDYVQANTSFKIDTFKTGDSKRIPLEFFVEPNSNYLSSLVNGANYPIKLTHGITNKFTLDDETTEHDSIKLINGNYGYLGDNAYYTDEIIKAVNVPGTSYNIDAITIKAVTRFAYRLVFYDESGNEVWETVRMTDAGYTGNILDWESTVPLSDIQDDDRLWDDPNHKYAQFTDKNPQTVRDANSEEKSKERAEADLNNKQPIDLQIRQTGNSAITQSFTPRAIDSNYNRSSDPLRWKGGVENFSAGTASFSWTWKNYESKRDSRTIAHLAPHRLVLPKYITDDLALVYEESLRNTRRKRWQLLVDNHGYKTITIITEQLSFKPHAFSSAINFHSGHDHHHPPWDGNPDRGGEEPRYAFDIGLEPFTIKPRSFAYADIPETHDPVNSRLTYEGRTIGNLDSWNAGRKIRFNYYAIRWNSATAARTDVWWRWNRSTTDNPSIYKLPPFISWWQDQDDGNHVQGMYLGYDFLKYPIRIITRLDTRFTGAGVGTFGPFWSDKFILGWKPKSVQLTV